MHPRLQCASPVPGTRRWRMSVHASIDGANERESVRYAYALDGVSPAGIFMEACIFICAQMYVFECERRLDRCRL